MFFMLLYSVLCCFMLFYVDLWGLAVLGIDLAAPGMDLAAPAVDLPAPAVDLFTLER